jgi:hypothetical protein
LDIVAKIRFDYHALFDFQNCVLFRTLRIILTNNKIMAFYCNVERQEDEMTLICPFRNKVVSLTTAHWSKLVGLECE